MQRTHIAATLAATLALACAAPLAAAQAAPPPQNRPGVTHAPPFPSTPPQQAPQALPPSSSQSTRSDAAMGQHDMSGTVTSVSSDDIVGLRTDDGTLKLHFPHAHERLQKGDRITVHLGYTIDSHANPGSGVGQ